VPADRKALCIVCEKRKQRFVNKTCETCNALVDAEGTHEQFGVPTKSATQLKWEEKCKEYNQLIRQRFLQREIAAMWGMSCTSLRNYVHRWKVSGKLKVVPAMGNSARVPEKKPRQPTSQVRKIVNEHGGGKWGKAGCDCDPCADRRRHSRMLQNRAYRARRRQRREENEKDKPS
jgi:hypothetical protein